MNHTGEAAWPEPVLAAIIALAGGLRQLDRAGNLELALSVAERTLFD